MEKIELDGYRIWMGRVVSSLTEVLEPFPASRIFVLADENTYTHCLPMIEPALTNRDYRVFKIKAGESHKVIETAVEIWHAMTQAQLDRHSILINLGGGVIGDMGGFCAATYKRGIKFIQIPTTLLSQVDASIGGKLGIDFEGYKNHIGVFQSPQAVLIDPVFLNTLSDRELRSGYAEIIKHSLIADGGHWEALSQIRELRKADWYSIIRRSIEVKRKIVLADPYEKGIRKLLNFGHTLGHAIESHFLHSPNPLLHGEAIAAGMIYEAKLSQWYAGFAVEKMHRITKYIEDIYGHPPAVERADLMPILRQDKKNKEGKISFSLLDDIGSSKWDVMLTENEIIF